MKLSRAAVFTVALTAFCVVVGGHLGTSSEALAQRYQMVVANTTAEDTQERLAQLFIDLVAEKSGGRITGTLHTGSSLGDNLEVLQGVQGGWIHATINPTAFLSTFVPEMGVLELPWLYPGETYAEVIENITRSMRGRAGAQLRLLAEARGFRLVSLFGLSPQVILSNRPINGLADLRGARIRVVPGEEHVGTFEDWGALPQAMPLAEVYTSIQQRVIDGVEDPPDVSLKMNFHEVAPYVADTRHSAFVEYLVVGADWYRSLPPDLQAVIDEAGRELEVLGTQAYIESEEAAIEALRQHPRVTVVRFSREDLAEMERLNQQGIWQRVRRDPVKGPFLEQLLKDIEELAK